MRRVSPLTKLLRLEALSTSVRRCTIPPNQCDVLWAASALQMQRGCPYSTPYTPLVESRTFRNSVVSVVNRRPQPTPTSSPTLLRPRPLPNRPPPCSITSTRSLTLPRRATIKSALNLPCIHTQPLSPACPLVQYSVQQCATDIPPVHA